MKNAIWDFANLLEINLDKEFYFIGKTDEEYSLVCITEDTPANTLEREDGWKGFRIQGILDFFDRALKILSLAGYDIV